MCKEFDFEYNSGFTITHNIRSHHFDRIRCGWHNKTYIKKGKGL